MNIVDGWLAGREVRQLPSPNCDARPCDAGRITDDISLLVIHNISLPPGQFGGRYIDALFTNGLDTAEHPFFSEIAGLKVSAHLLIDREGRITQYVPFVHRAWHAGKSSFRGRENCNDFSIGIELEGTDDEPYTEAQYSQLAAVTRQILLEYPRIKPENIVGHCDISPGRKTDPGTSFDWDRYRRSVNQPDGYC